MTSSSEHIGQRQEGDHPKKATPPYVDFANLADGIIGAQMDIVISLVGGVASGWVIDLKDPDYLDDYSYGFDAVTGAFSFTPTKEGRYILRATALDSESAQIAMGLRNFNATMPVSSSSASSQSESSVSSISVTSASSSSKSSVSSVSSLYGYLAAPANVQMANIDMIGKTVDLLWEWANESSAYPDEPTGFMVEKSVGDGQWQIATWELGPSERAFADQLSDSEAASVFIHGLKLRYRIRAYWIE